MPLSNFDYEKIFREYEKKQMRTWHLLDVRRRDIYFLIPEYKILDENIISMEKNVTVSGKLLLIFYIPTLILNLCWMRKIFPLFP